jgi:hypothetical protein
MLNTGDAASSSPGGGKVIYPVRGFPAITGETRAPAALVAAGRRRAGADFAAEEADGGERMKLGTVRVNGEAEPGGRVEVTISGIGTRGNPAEIR